MILSVKGREFKSRGSLEYITSLNWRLKKMEWKIFIYTQESSNVIIHVSSARVIFWKYLILIPYIISIIPHKLIRIWSWCGFFLIPYEEGILREISGYPGMTSSFDGSHPVPFITEQRAHKTLCLRGELIPSLILWKIQFSYGMKHLFTAPKLHQSDL